MFKVMGVRGVSHVQGDDKGGEGRQPCSRLWQRVRGVSHVQGDGRGCRGVSHVQGHVRSVSHVQGNGRGGGGGASAMFKPMGGGEGRQPCSM